MIEGKAMLRRMLLPLLPVMYAASGQDQPRFPREPEDSENRLPNGRLQRDEILKAEHEKSLQDASELMKLAQDLKTDLEKSTAFVVSVGAIKKTEDIEKLAKRIRGRLKRA
jgi:hypothetical protein